MKKSLLIFLVVIICATMCACGGNSDDAASSETVFQEASLFDYNDDASCSMTVSQETSLPDDSENIDESVEQKDEGETAFAEGVAFYNDKDYQSAIERFLQISSDSVKFDDAQSMLEKCEDEYSASIVEKANGYAMNGEHELAIKLLENAMDLFQDNEDLSTAYNSIFSEYAEIVCTNAFFEADSFASNGDYPSAITTIDNAIALVGDNEELFAKRELYVDKYVSRAVSAAKLQYVEYDYNSIIAAENILETALKTLPDNEVLNDELAYYKEREPVRLLDLIASPNLRYDASTSTFEYVGVKSDIAGIAYDDAVAPADWFENSHPYGWSETYSYAHYSWLLDYQYTKLTGTFFFSEDYKNASIEIELTITTSTDSAQHYFISNDEQAQHFDVDLTGTKDFEIALKQSEIDGTYAFLAEVYVWK